ncbi:MAG: PAS domain S-box protein [Syntrophaceae bacterium]|nr:PAS domain S-box protein [Syntrophaceae bacterium]
MNEISPFLGLVHNAALLLAVAYFFDVSAARWKTDRTLFPQVPFGIVIGAVGITVMMTSWALTPGLIFDTRSVLLSVSGLFFGSIPTVIAMAMTAAFRIYQGGPGAVMGVSVIAATGTVGILWRHLRRRSLAEMSWRELYLFGIATHLVMLGLTFTLPLEIALWTLSRITLPVLLIYPPGTALLGMLMVNRLQREQADEKLQEREEKYRSLFDHSRDAILLTRPDGFILDANPSACEMFGRSLEGIRSVGRNGLVDVTDPRLNEALSERAHTGGGMAEITMLRANGDKFPAEITSTVFADTSGQQKTSMIIRDVTERKRAEDALREKEDLLSLITENMSDMIRITDLQGRNLYSSPSHFKGLGYRAEDRIGKSSFDLVHPDDVERMSNEFIEGFFGNRRVTTEYRIKHADGHYVWLETVADLLRDDRGEASAVIMSSRDISERKKAEEGLHESQRRLSDIIEFLPDATLVIDSEGKVIAWNRAIEAMTGVKKEEMLGKGNYEYSIPFYGERRPILIDLALHPDPKKEKEYLTVRRMDDLLLGDAHTPALAPGNVHLSGTASVLRDSEGNIVGAIECIRDYTDRKNMEERLQRAEKMESLGILAGGVAHDLNNVLGVLVGYSELLLRDVQEGSRAEKYAKSILQGGGRAAAIIQDLLTMARRGVSVSETVNLNRIAADAFKTPEFELVKTHHPDVLFQSHMEKDLFNIKGSPVHLSKSIMNLLSNAAESIHGKGVVTITTENRYVDVAIPGYENTREGEYVVLTVTDTGSGISPADMERIFEPFYTKKVMGRSGTGLGLAVVWGTVKDHGGYIDVRTEEDKGSSFVLYFPVTREALSKTDQALSESEYRGRGESILIVDDVEEQRSLAAVILEGLSYRVASAASGEEAVEYLRTNKADLIVLDMIMDPGIDGLETYCRILEIRPRQKAIIVSGFARTERVKMAQAMGAGEYVMKPYVIERLGMAVRKELDKM